tara:strand:- start:67 stop:1341 length:1275 start_codon:yes stop_codon:yes gene_type:complete
MKSILKKILSYKKNLIQKEILFKELKKNKAIKQVFEAIAEFSNKSEIRYVGGCVRKILNNETIDDIDLATNIIPQQVSEALKKKQINFYNTGLEHGTITAEINGENFEITSLRNDISTDGRHAVVKFTDNWHEDASRRDFTINSIYSDLDGNLFDPFNGKQDLKDGKIIFIGEADKRIKEDYLRILRYIRFFLNYSNNDHDKQIKKIIKQNISGVKNISNERLLDELKKLVLSKGFLKINDDEFCMEILLLIFPQLKNIRLFKNLNKYAKAHFSSSDFIFLLSLMIIDETDNSDYFLYKFKVSNEAKKRIKFIKGIFSKPLEKDAFSQKNLWKIYYFNNKNYLDDIINFQLFRSKKIDSKLLKLKDFFSLQTQPVFPVKARQLIEDYDLKEGKELGQKLKQIENIWIKNSFKISNKEIDKIVNN